MKLFLILVFFTLQLLAIHTYVYDDSQKMLDEIDQSLERTHTRISKLCNLNESMSKFLQDISIPPGIFENCIEKEIYDRAYSDDNSPTKRQETFKSFKYDIMEVLKTYDPNNKWTVQDPIESSRFCLCSKRDTYRLFKNDILFTEFKMPNFSIYEVIKLLDQKLPCVNH